MDMPEDVARDEWIAQLSDFAIEEHAFDRLRSYYVEHPDLAKSAFQIFNEGCDVINASASAAVILLMTSFEVALKAAILKPIIYGIVHNESLSDMVSDVVMRGNGVSGHKSMLSAITQQFGDIDLENVQLGESATPFWKLFEQTMKVRNMVVHQGKLANRIDAENAVELSMWVLSDVFPAILRRCGMKLIDYQVVNSLHDVEPPSDDDWDVSALLR